MIDLFPVIITVQTTMETLVTTRARLDGNWLSVWCENPSWPHDPLLVVNAEIDAPPILNTISSNVPARKQRLVVMTIADPGHTGRVVYEIKRQGGCGCGSRLKAAKLSATRDQPTAPWPSVRNPAPVRSQIDDVLRQHFPALADK